MNCVRSLLLLFILWETVDALLTIYDANRVREHPDKCFSFPLGKAFSVGRTWELPGCGRCTCARQGTTRNALKEHVESCPAIRPQRPCYLAPMNPRLNYPQCCPKTVCPGDTDFKSYICPSNQFQPQQNEKWSSDGGP